MKRYIVTIEPDGPAYLSAGEHGSVDLYGDIALFAGVAKSKVKAAQLAVLILPKEAFPDGCTFSDPEIIHKMGLRVYELV